MDALGTDYEIIDNLNLIDMAAKGCINQHEGKGAFPRGGVEGVPCVR